MRESSNDRGNTYQVTIRDIGSPVLRWTLMLFPDPPHDPQWLDLATTAVVRPRHGGSRRLAVAGSQPARTPTPQSRLYQRIAFLRARLGWVPMHDVPVVRREQYERRKP